MTDALDLHKIFIQRNSNRLTSFHRLSVWGVDIFNQPTFSLFGRHGGFSLIHGG